MRFRAGFTLAMAFAAISAALGGSNLLTTLRPGHPRLLAGPEDFERVRREAIADPLQAKLDSETIARATTLLSATPLEYHLGAEGTRPSMLPESRAVLGRIVDCALAYRLTGDLRYAARGREELLSACRYPQWNPAHFLDVGEMCFGVAVGYDWLYETLSAPDRAAVKRAIIDKALVWGIRAYRGEGRSALDFPRVNYNWNQVCNGGLLAGALAIADEEPALAGQILAGVRKSVPIALKAYDPDGGWEEGPTYWGYGTTYHVLILAMLKSSIGTDLGLGEGRGFRNTGYFRLWTDAPSGKCFNYGDGGPDPGDTPALAWLGREYAEPAVTEYARLLLERDLRSPGGSGQFERFGGLETLWFPHDTGTAAIAKLSLAKHFRGHADLAIFRSSWLDPNAVFLGVRAGRNRVNHAHLELGSFLLESDGRRWANFLGPDSYNLPGYFDQSNRDGKRFSYFRISAASQNTLTPEGIPQDPFGEAPIIAFRGAKPAAILQTYPVQPAPSVVVQANGGGPFAIIDLTKAYPGVANRVLRGVRFLDSGARIVIRDEIEDPASNRAWRWAMVTSAAIELRGNEARLTSSGKSLIVRVLEPTDARLEIQSAKPPTPAENPNKGFRILALRVAAAASGVTPILVELTQGSRAHEALQAENLPLVQWR